MAKSEKGCIECERYTVSYVLQDNAVNIIIFENATLASINFVIRSRIWINAVRNDAQFGLLHIMAWLAGSLPNEIEAQIPEIHSDRTVAERNQILHKMAELGVTTQVFDEITLEILDM